MRNMSMLQLIGGVAAAGVIAAGTTALTGSGVSFGGGLTGSATQLVGGTLTQTLNGASITGVVYGYNDLAKTQTNSIAITVTSASAGYLTVTPDTGGAWGGTSGGTTPDEWSCTNVANANTKAAAPKVAFAATTDTITCVPYRSVATAGAMGYYTGLSSVDMTVTPS